MQECELIDNCPFYNGQLEGDEEQIKILKEKYCHKTYFKCARFMIFTALGRESVPKELLPHQKDKAYVLIAESD